MLMTKANGTKLMDKSGYMILQSERATQETIICTMSTCYTLIGC